MMETTETTEPIEAKPQYQHLIQGFVLREFAEAPATTASAAASRERTAGVGGMAKRKNKRWKNKKTGRGIRGLVEKGIVMIGHRGRM